MDNLTSLPDWGYALMFLAGVAGAWRAVFWLIDRL